MFVDDEDETVDEAEPVSRAMSGGSDGGRPFAAAIDSDRHGHDGRQGRDVTTA